MNCPECDKPMVKAGKHRNRKGLWQQWKCQHCGIMRLGEKFD